MDQTQVIASCPAIVSCPFFSQTGTCCDPLFTHLLESTCFLVQHASVVLWVSALILPAGTAVTGRHSGLALVDDRPARQRSTGTL